MKIKLAYFVLVCIFCTQGQKCDDKKAMNCLIPKLNDYNNAKISGNITAQCIMAVQMVNCLKEVPNCVNQTHVEDAEMILKNLTCIIDNGVTLFTSSWLLVVGLAVAAFTVQVN